MWTMVLYDKTSDGGLPVKLLSAGVTQHFHTLILRLLKGGDCN